MSIENYINEINTNGFTILKSVIDPSKVNEILYPILWNELNSLQDPLEMKSLPKLEEIK